MAELIRMDALPNSIQTVNLAGEPFQNILVQQIYAKKHVKKLYNLYGPSETTTYSSVALIAKDTDEIPPIGEPVANTQIYLLDEHLEPVPFGSIGEIYIGGNGVAREYFGRPGLTAERFLSDPFYPEKGKRMYRTGDLAQYRKDRQLHFLGRIDHQVKIRGFRIEMEEIETALSLYQGIKEVVVMLREDIPGNKRIIAYICSQKALQGKDLRTFLQQKLPDYMIPSHFVFLESLPRTPNGKLDRKALPIPEEQNKEAKEIIPPKTQIEAQLLAIFQEVLRVPQISMEDNFFELGGDSILSMQIIAKASQKGIRLSPKQIFRSQTIALLSQEIQTKSMPQAEQGFITGNFPLTPIQHWFFEQNIPHPDHWNQSIALSLKQRIEPLVFQQAIETIVKHHDGLRLRFECKNNQWEQTIVSYTNSMPLNLFDLCSLSPEEQEQTMYNTMSQLQASLNIQKGPIGQAALFDTDSTMPQKLYMLFHHLVIDGVSWRILLEDLETAYFQIAQGKIVSLPPKTTSLPHWSSRLQEYAQTHTLKEETKHWCSPRCATPLPIDYPQGQNTEQSTHTIETILSEQDTLFLLQEMPKHQTTLQEMLLAVLAQSICTWTKQNSVCFDIEGHGREEIFHDIHLSRTTGWFTTIYPIHFCFAPHISLQEKLEQVHTTLTLSPNHGLGYGVLRYLCQDKNIQQKFHHLAQPQILFNYLGQFDSLFQNSQLFQLSYHAKTGHAHSPKAQRRHLLDIDALITNQKLHIKWHYSQNIYNLKTINNLVQAWETELKHWMQNISMPKTTKPHLPLSDIPLSKQSMDDILAEIED
jgi:non-ribosomal peptide synthase protein (TIGR01720 family)